jgi:hypothetical protein
MRAYSSRKGLVAGVDKSPQLPQQCAGRLPVCFRFGNIAPRLIGAVSLALGAPSLATVHATDSLSRIAG